MRAALASLALALLAADIVLKAMASLGVRVELIPRFLTFALVSNQSLAFGVPVTGTLSLVLHLTLFLIVTALAVSRLIVGTGRGYWLLLIGVAGGINLTDRYVYGAVRDYLVFGVPFPIFNLADLVILLGVLGFIGSFDFQRRDALRARYVVPR